MSKEVFVNLIWSFDDNYIGLAEKDNKYLKFKIIPRPNKEFIREESNYNWYCYAKKVISKLNKENIIKENS